MPVKYQYAQFLEGFGSVATDVGGKASSLDRLVADGFPVPRAAVLTADAYRAFVDYADLGSFLKELQESDLPTPDAQVAETARVEKAFIDAPMSRELEQDILELVEDFLGRSPIAVRSSATAEDMVTASFAGQYETFLGVKTSSEALNAIRRCWASLWSPQVRAYRRREQVSEENLAMAVIIQAMVDAVWAGVIFTRDPQGRPDDMKIEAVPGLGDDLVSGRVTPRGFVVDRDTLTVRVRGKRTPLAFLEDLARLSLRIESGAGSPQDIEWAYTERGISVLQARPITVTRPLAAHDDGFDTPVVGDDEYTPRGVAEMLPGVVSPLLWSINAPMLEDAFRSLFASIGVSQIAAGRHVLGRFRGRATLNLSVLRDVATSLPGGSGEEVERQYLGHPLDRQADAAQPSNGGGITRLRASIRNWRANKLVREEVELVKRAVEGIAHLNIDLSSLPVERLLTYRSRSRDLAWRIYATEVASSSAAAAAYRALELRVGKWLGEEEGARWAQRLTAGTLAESAVGAARVARLREIFDRHAATNPTLRTALIHGGDRPRMPIEALGNQGEAFLEELDHCVRAFGSQAVFAGRTWNEDIVGVWSQLLSFAKTSERMAASASEDALAELVLLLKTSPRWRIKRVVTGQLVDMRLRHLRRLVDEATLHLRNREDSKAALLVLGGVERRGILESAERLVVSGHLRASEDVELFSDGELERMLLGEEPVFGQELERRRRALQRARDAGPLPEVFAGHPDVVERSEVEAGPVLQGWAASPGTIRGTARVLGSLEDGVNLKSGEIIIAHSTDPSWTPLFLTAGGIVLEEGGPLSHAAIVAREFGLPAVLNVADATAVIVDGEEVVVDGTQGEVRRVGKKA
jgi:pyruvate,water dikinase